MITEEKWKKMNWTERITWIFRAVNLSVLFIFMFRFYRGEFRTPLELIWISCVFLALGFPWILMALGEYRIERRKKKE